MAHRLLCLSPLWLSGAARQRGKSQFSSALVRTSDVKNHSRGVCGYEKHRSPSCKVHAPTPIRAARCNSKRPPRRHRPGHGKRSKHDLLQRADFDIHRVQPLVREERLVFRPCNLHSWKTIRSLGNVVDQTANGQQCTRVCKMCLTFNLPNETARA